MKRTNNHFKAGLIPLMFVYMVLILSTIPSTVIKAQKNGNVSGRVIDVDTKVYLPGANIILPILQW